MMQSANFRERDHVSFGRRLNTPCRRGVLLQGEVRSRPVIIGDVRGQDASQMSLADDDHVVVHRHNLATGDFPANQFAEKATFDHPSRLSPKRRRSNSVLEMR